MQMGLAAQNKRILRAGLAPLDTVFNAFNGYMKTNMSDRRTPLELLRMDLHGVVMDTRVTNPECASFAGFGGMYLADSVEHCLDNFRLAHFVLYPDDAPPTATPLPTQTHSPTAQAQLPS
jgi:hypothetical protein